MMPRVSSRSIVGGIVSFVPGAYSFYQSLRSAQGRGGGSTGEASYCYNSWLKHLVCLQNAGMVALPKQVCELGPGATVGFGIATLLSGASRYTALDVSDFYEAQTNIHIVHELVDLFRERARLREGIFDDSQSKYSLNFPEDLFPDLDANISPERVAAIENALLEPGKEFDGITIQYHAPYTFREVAPKEAFDLIISNAVLEHVDDLETVYANMAYWIKPQGWLSHQIDFRSHAITLEWNGHWALSESLWKVIRGRRPYLINREPLSRHLKLAESNGFVTRLCNKKVSSSGIPRSELTKRWETLCEEDFTCESAYIASQGVVS